MQGSRFEKMIGWLALAGLLLSLAVHVSALLRVGPTADLAAYIPLHLGIFVVFLPVVLSARKRFDGHARLRDLRAMFPDWVVVLFALTLVYAVVNFFLFMLATGGGSPSMTAGGQYVLNDHGRVVREISAQEYAGFRANEVRGFSGHWIYFYFIAFAYFMLRKRDTQARP